MILDSEFLLSLSDRDADAFEKSAKLHDEGEVMKIPLPAVLEIYYGAYFTESDEEKRKLDNLMLMYHFADADAGTMEHGAELVANADRNAPNDESGVSNEDAVIGAIAEELGDTVLTRNADDFDKLGVSYETY